jgi:hypothetical protein
MNNAFEANLDIEHENGVEQVKDESRRTEKIISNIEGGEVPFLIICYRPLL